MAAALTLTATHSIGDTLYLYEGTVACTGTYSTGGEALDPALNEQITHIIACPDGTAAGGAGYDVEWNPATNKLLFFYNDYDAVADGQHIQVPNATALTTITALRVLVLGQ